MVSLLNGISTIVCYLMLTIPLQKNSSDIIQPKAGEVRTFSNGICVKVDVITQLDIKYQCSDFKTEPVWTKIDNLWLNIWAVTISLLIEVKLLNTVGILL